ncbi:AlbA family DNA-binding domain-containing protein [Aeoliella sp.]|uniref:AlbA family DNA-binding domain-containing protein n=1 Tax=Aeoliella sp. TaxID=2795800 RepID=UPI003CCC2273
MIKRPIDIIDRQDVDALIADRVSESKTLEYKQQLPGNTDSAKKEFLADVSSFANASGGDILFGIQPEVDSSGTKTGAAGGVQPISTAVTDEAKLRLEEIIRNGISPRLPVAIRVISGWGADNVGCVIMLRIPKSFAAPHAVVYKGSSRFYSRHSAGKYQLDVDELRTAFLATDSQAQRIRQFRIDRIAKVVADETPVLLKTPHRLVLHLIPLSSLAAAGRIDLTNSHPLRTLFPPIATGGWNYRYNLDGFVLHSTSKEDGELNKSYCQLFFNGIVEAVYADILRAAQGSPVQDGVGGIASVAYEQSVISAVESYIQGYQKLAIAPPVYVSMALLNCKGSFLYVHPSRLLSGELQVIDREVALMPDVVLESFDEDVAKSLRPMFDAVWNACGFARSFNYDENGDWKPK